MAWLNEPSKDEPGLTRYLHAVWLRRPDVQRAYPEPGTHDRDGFLGWCVVHGRGQMGIPETLLAQHPPGDGAAPAARPAPDDAPEVASGSGPGLPLGVNVAGYLRSELGIGEIARQLVSALDAVGVPALPVGLNAPNSRQGHHYATAGTERNPFAVNLICVNADGLPAFAEQAGPGFFHGKYNIGFWWWETSSFPEKDFGAFTHLDEIWVGSRFIAEALSEVSPIPVVQVPVALEFPLASRLAPGALGLPEAFTVLFSYDYNSVATRKNPLGALEAYTRAFRPEDGTVLVLKSINSHLHAAQHRLVLEAAAGRPDVFVLDDYLEPSEKDRLMASCDCYLSLHRSEGFGLTLAEAMYFGKPVVATNYSGNTDFMTSENSYLVDYRLVPIGAGADPYPPDGEWAEPDVDHAAALLREVQANPRKAAERGVRAAQDIRGLYGPYVTGQALEARLRRIEPRVRAAEQARPTGDGRDKLAGLVARAGSPGAPSRFGKPGAAVRKLALRAMKPYTAYQHDVNRALATQIDERGSALDATTRTEDRLTESLATVMAELRQQRSALNRLEAAPRPDIVRAVDERVDDLATQMDLVRKLVTQHESHLHAGGIGGADMLRDAVDLPVAPDAEPWSEAYTDAHRTFVGAALDDPVFISRFRGAQVDARGYGRGFDERVVEYPWLAAQRLGGLVLDAGSVLNHLHVITRLRVRMDDLHILTLEPEPESFAQMHVSYLFADLRKLPIADATYDRVLSISTLEHVGMNNEYYGSADVKADEPQREMLKAVTELRRVLKPGGDLYITVPVGEPDRFEWVRALAPNEVDDIIESFAPSSMSLQFFRHGAEGWAPTDRDGVEGARYRDHFSSGPVGEGRVVAAEAVACLHLRKAG